MVSPAKDSVRIEPQTTWYLWAVDDNPRTNEYLARVVGEQNPECERRDVLCADKKRRNLWRCPRGWDNVLSAKSAVTQCKLNFEVFKENSEGAVYQYNLWKSVVRKKANRTRRLRAIAKIRLKKGGIR